MKQAKFHSEFARATVIVNGVPLSLNAEVFVEIKRPSKLDPASRRAWNQMTAESTDAITVELIPGAN